MICNYKTIWISDVHLGTRACKAQYLVDFLQHVEAECIYLVGDMIDLWRMKSGFYWPASHNEVLKLLIHKAEQGTRIVYIPGNHDDLLRHYLNLEVLGIEMHKHLVHTTADGRRLLVMHGDEFDGVVCSSKWLTHIGSWSYEGLVWLNIAFNHIRHKLGLSYWSLSYYLKHKVKNAVDYMDNFKSILTHEARQKGMDGVVCGHIHHALIEDMENGFTYYNCGDWVEICTALVEDASGKIDLIHWARDSVHLLQDQDQARDTNDRDRTREYEPDPVTP